MFYIIIVVVIQLCVFVKNHQLTGLQLVNVIVCKLNFQETDQKCWKQTKIPTSNCF